MKRPVLITVLLTPLLAWIAYWTFSYRVASMISHRWGQRIVQAGDGKFSDAAAFLQHRFYEGAWLLTLTVVLAVAGIGFGAILARLLPSLWKWVPFSATGFVAANVWFKLAFGTCFFWCLFWNGKGTTSNLTQFHIKLLLMNENRTPVKVALAGSSQVRAQIDPRVLNKHFDSKIFTTDLDYPGNRSFDFLLLNHQLEGSQADAIFCYLSELNFFSGPIGEGSTYFFNFRDVPEFFELSGKPGWSPGILASGLLGEVLPVFWVREPLTQRLLGGQLAGLRQKSRDAALNSDLTQRALEAAPGYKANAQSDFSFHAFEAFVEKCRAQHRLVIACCGQLNPILQRKLDPALRPQMRAFLHKLAANYDNFRLLDEDQLPTQTESDYEDLTHTTEEARARFTKALEPVLQELLLPQQHSAQKVAADASPAVEGGILPPGNAAGTQGSGPKGRQSTARG